HQRAGTHHSLRLQFRALENLGTPTDPHPIGDAHITCVIDPLTTFHIDDRVLVSGTNQNIGSQHAITANADTRGLVDEKVRALHRGIGTDPDVLAPGVSQIDFAGLETNAVSDLDQVVFTIETDLTITN